MKRDNGFTLIELLAVVILLGLIAVISVPVVKNITKDAKKKGLEKQISVVLQSAKNWAIQNTDLLPEGEEPILVKIETLKSEGLLENKKIINPVDNKEMNGCAEISYNEGYNQYEYVYNEKCMSSNRLFTTSTSLDINSIDKCVTNGTKCEAGTALAISVNSKKNEKFYVLKDEDDKLTLILNRNFDLSESENGLWYGYVEWNTNGDRNAGPTEILNFIQDVTSVWDNLPEMTISTFDYDDGSEAFLENDKTFITHARMPKYSDLIDFADENFYLPSWLIGDYWLSTADSSSGSNAYFVYDDGGLGSDNIGAGSWGVRVVIEISKNVSIF